MAKDDKPAETKPAETRPPKQEPVPLNGQPPGQVLRRTVHGPQHRLPRPSTPMEHLRAALKLPESVSDGAVQMEAAERLRQYQHQELVSAMGMGGGARG